MQSRIMLSAAVVAGLLLGGETGALAAAPEQLVTAAGKDTGKVELVKKKKKKKKRSDDDDDRDWMYYLKAAYFFDTLDVTETIEDGRVGEHLLGGLLSGFGGHWWGPGMFYKDVEMPDAARTIAIFSIIVGWIMVPLVLIAWFPYIGWAIGFFIGIPLLAFVIASEFWFIPRALQFAYSDADTGEGGRSKKKKRSRDDDDDDEYE